MTTSVKSATRILDILELLPFCPSGLSLAEVTERLALPKSSALALLRTIVARGYAVRDRRDRYSIAGSFKIGGFAPFGRLLSVAPLIMRNMADKIGETVVLATLNDHDGVRILAKEVSRQDIRYDIDLSREPPAYCTAVGRALIAQLSDTDARAILSRAPARGQTRHTITAKAGLWEEIRKARRRGIAIVAEEAELGGTGVAAVIPDVPGPIQVALNVACVSGRFNDQRDRIIDALRCGIEAIGRELAKEQGNIRGRAPLVDSVA